MINCCECNMKINIENCVYRCFDGTVCSKNCQKERCFKIKLKDKNMCNFNIWGNTTSYLLDPIETTRELQRVPSFIPIYVKERSQIKKTASNYDINNINIKYNNNTNSYINENNSKINEYIMQNILVENFGNMGIFDSRLIDSSYNLLYNGVSKLYNIMNKII